jgi:fused signal recognition particle receptor
MAEHGGVRGVGLGRLAAALARTRDAFGERLGGLFAGGAVTQATLDELEEALIAGDVGVAAAAALVERVRQARPRRGEDLRSALVAAVAAAMGPAQALARAASGPTVWVLVGVNGAGKTTTAGKLAAQAVARGERVLLAAADTFRAAAAEQLALWAERAGASLVRGAPGGDPAAVAFDAVRAAKARGVDLLVVDTAGRLQTKEPLMAELAKVMRVIGRECDGAPHERLLVLDATVGQNALSQARLFGQAADVTGIVLAKMDSSARGGSALAVRHELGLPVRLVGTGEGVDDLSAFDPEAYARALVAGPTSMP